MIRNTLASLALGLGLALSAPALADTVEVPTNGRPLVVEVPDGWDTDDVPRGVQLNTEDDDVYLWIETYPASEFEAVKKEIGAFVEEQGISITGEPKISAHPFEKYGVAVLDFPATWKGDATVLRYLVVEPKNPAKSRLIVGYWATPEGDKKHDAETQKIIDSLAVALATD